MVELCVWLLVVTGVGSGFLFFVGTAPLSRPQSPSPFVVCDECLSEVRATRAECPRCGSALSG